MQRDDEFYRCAVDHSPEGVYFVSRRRRIQYWNAAATSIAGFDSAEVVGRRCKDHMLMHVDDAGAELCRERCPLVHTMVDGRPRHARAYLRHKEGHRVPIDMRTVAVRSPRGEIIGAVELFKDASEADRTQEKLDELEHLALFDALTEIGNRRYLTMNLESRLEDLGRYGWPFAAVLGDIDDFRAVNDTHGHDAGDAVLRMVARTLAHDVREADVVGRWGGEEFLLLVGTTNEAALAMTTERLRSLVAACELDRDPEPVRVTLSLGATMAQPGDTAETLLRRAGDLLYRSKSDGRNRMTTG